MLKKRIRLYLQQQYRLEFFVLYIQDYLQVKLFPYRLCATQAVHSRFSLSSIKLLYVFLKPKPTFFFRGFSTIKLNFFLKGQGVKICETCAKMFQTDQQRKIQGAISGVQSRCSTKNIKLPSMLATIIQPSGFSL